LKSWREKATATNTAQPPGYAGVSGVRLEDLRCSRAPPLQKHYRCRVYGPELPAWLPAAKRPNGAMLLHHLSDRHPDQVSPYLKRMETEDIGTVAAEGFEGIEGEQGKVRTGVLVQAGEEE
jgi:hypothetical protein